MGAILIAIGLISGYIFVINYWVTKYQFKRASNWDAYFYVAGFGVLFSLLGGIITFALASTPLFPSLLTQAHHEYTDLALLKNIKGLESALPELITVIIWACFALLFAWLTTLALNKYYSGKRYYKKWSNLLQADPQGAMLLEAGLSQFPTRIVLKSNKIYIGWIIPPPIHRGTISHIAMLPLYSGYRDPDKLTMEITTDYLTHYVKLGVIGDAPKTTDLRLDDYRIIINKQDTDTISFFSFEEFEDF